MRTSGAPASEASRVPAPRPGGPPGQEPPRAGGHRQSDGPAGRRGSGRGGRPDPTLPPVGLGDDPALDQLAQACFDGDMTSCDDLFRTSPLDSAYEDHGDSCAGRQDLGTDVFCDVAFG